MEGELIWLDADTKIRELTGGKKSLDDFCKEFLGVYNGSIITDQYTLNDVVKDSERSCALRLESLL